MNNPSRYTDPSGHVASDVTDGTGCGPDCLLKHLVYKDQQLNKALGEYFRTHPDYDPAADSKLNQMDQAQVTSAKFWYDVDDGTASLGSMMAFAANAGVVSMGVGPRWVPTVNTDGDFYYTRVSCNSFQCVAGVNDPTLDILYPNGQPIGTQQGRDPRIRTVQNQEELQQVFDALTVDATPLRNGGYRLPDGGFVRLRDSREYGPTIDINIPGIEIDKIHLPMPK